MFLLPFYGGESWDWEGFFALSHAVSLVSGQAGIQILLCKASAFSFFGLISCIMVWLVFFAHKSLDPETTERRSTATSTDFCSPARCIFFSHSLEILQEEEILIWSQKFFPHFLSVLTTALWGREECPDILHMKLLQSCLTLWDPMNCSLPDSPIHGILQARILEQAAIPSSRGSSRSRYRTHISYVSCIGRQVLYH